MRIAIVGAGPAGSLLATKLAAGGIEATVFDASHPREKPCGGGLTGKALRELPAGPPGDPLPARRVASCRFEADGGAVEVPLREPVAIASRRELDAWLLRRATAAGARHVAERVVEVARGEVRTAASGRQAFDLVVGADGANSLVRRTFLGPLPKERLAMAVGWYSPGVAPMVVRFTPPLSGYLWAFPRPDHVGVGICAPLGEAPTRSLWERLEREVARTMPALWDPGAVRYAHTIPSPSADPRDIRESAGDGFALVGDAAALADPITGEGIFYALRSAALLAETLLAEGSPARYPERVLADFGRDLLKAAALHRRFYAPGFAGRMVRYAARSHAIRDVLGDLVLGQQGYVGLKRRLLRTLPRFLVEAAWSGVRPGARYERRRT
ncbi:MAG TPA: NAD(P)/FAD-dependent oxidoreductase [Vicinamibacteria bacterium]|nr:NAD(P)/FAD-dependent oxidoreductase [Vicinamibacteria bacterium]